MSLHGTETLSETATSAPAAVAARAITPRMIIEGLAGALLIAANILLHPLLRPWRGRWGATEAEARQPLPGDELAPSPKMVATRAVTIMAPPSAIWPWLVQLGCGRAGWYSYDLLDNGGVPSAERIIPQFQHLEPGEGVAMTPGGQMKMPVVVVEPYRRLILGGTIDQSNGGDILPGDPTPDKYFRWFWIILLQPLGENATRLIVRARLDYSRGLANALAFGLFTEPISFVMERKMLLGIKRRAEQAWRERGA
jgi:hypothetical protein